MVFFIGIFLLVKSPVCNSSSQLVQFGPRLADLLSRVDHVVRCLDPAPALDEVRHVGHDGAHVLCQHDDVIAIVVPFAYLNITKVEYVKEKE